MLKSPQNMTFDGILEKGQHHISSKLADLQDSTDFHFQNVSFLSKTDIRSIILLFIFKNGTDQTRQKGPI